ncbi:uncharacterized protein LOC101204305 isoform X1 [Cucumis sativus]|uniref:EF-Hand containing protein n=2 Tax=Cucumis sativus TaxID=3659 RepID=A0A0A0K5V6_CUCSA|nr:uncharacterized protein LOC101204305 isoform X1 [Cucumis sativus]KGN43221.1 hypothetical protein Csa_020463 [Cucumis sativus]
MDPLPSSPSSSSKPQVLDGSEIMELVANNHLFSSFVDHKFHDLDTDKDGKLSLQELHPAVADIGAALGLPPQGTSLDSDNIYSQVLNEFTHGSRDKVSKTEFKEVLSDILLGMAAGLKRDPIVILRMDGEDLLEFINSSAYEPEMVATFSEINLPEGSLQDYIVKAFEDLTVEQGMPPPSDSWVMSDIIEPALESCAAGENWDKPVSQEIFLLAFKRAAVHIAQRLKEQPVIVAHSENTFDGSSIRRLLSNKFELDKSLNAALQTVPRDKTGKLPKEHLQLALDLVAPLAGLPPLGALDEMDKLLLDVFKMVDADDGKVVKEEEFKKLLTEILGAVMLQLEGNPISVSSNSVVHEPLACSSTLLTPPS